ncbi:MAG: threonine/serine dehydratase [Chloroflexi bacterium]|nr:threonine/serine dehydratase [Chloroflexota bacterium]
MADDFLSAHAGEIATASKRISPFVRHTPLLPDSLDSGLLIKPECLQVTGSFKARGAFNAMLRLTESQPSLAGVIAVSSGNHAQGVALAGRTLGIAVVVVMPEDSNPAKVAATRALGAEVVIDGVSTLNREDIVRQLAAERNLHLLHPFDNWDVIHGQGTAAAELFADRPDTRLVVTPVGGGGLISGTAIAAKSHDASTVVIGVEPETAADAAASMASGRRESLSSPPATIADGVRTMAIGERNFEVISERRLVDGIVTVTEREIAEATVVAWERLKLAVEPTGALPLAAYLAGKLPESSLTALLISGGNASRSVMAEIFRTAADEPHVGGEDATRA